MGFAMSLPGVKTGRCDGLQPYLHSHMLAVEGYRNRGLGAQLKLEQRREALTRGIRHMEWTFDPLEIKNAYLNIHKLGAIVCELRCGFLWCILISTAGWASDGPAGGGVAAGFAEGRGNSRRPSAAARYRIN